MAGAGPLTAGRLAIAMLSLQAAIGALNDVVDAPRDLGLKPGKPIPAGDVDRREAIVVTVVTASLGLVLSAASGPATLVLAAAILAVGGSYDLRLKGTPWSWLPFAVGIPLLPVFAWLGTGSPLPAAFLPVLPAATMAGAALAIGNALVDVERDRAAGVTSIAAHLGPATAWRAMVVLYAAVLLLAVVTLVIEVSLVGVAGVTLIPGAALLVGVVLARAREPARRERGWELQAVGVAVLAAGWLSVRLIG